MEDVFEPCPLLPVRGHMPPLFSCIQWENSMLFLLRESFSRNGSLAPFTGTRKPEDG